MWVWKIRCSNKLAIDIYRLRDTDDCISLSTNFQIKPTCATVKTWQKVDMVRSHTVKKDHCRSLLESLLTDSWIDDLPPNTSNLSMFWPWPYGIWMPLAPNRSLPWLPDWKSQHLWHRPRLSPWSCRNLEERPGVVFVFGQKMVGNLGFEVVGKTK